MMIPQGRWLVRLWLLVCLLAGCRFPASTRPLVKVGLLAPFEGLYRPFGYEVLYAVKLAIRERNADGGVAGWGVELIALDDGLEADEARRAAEKVVMDADVMGVIGPFSAATAEAVAPILTKNALPWIAITPMADETLQMGRPYAFRLFASHRALADAAAQYVDEHTPRLAIIRAGDDAMADALAAALRQRGFDLAMDVRWDAPRWQMIERANAGALFVAGDAEAASDFLTGLRGRGLHLPVVVGPEAGKDVLAQRAGAYAEGVAWMSSVTNVPLSALPPSFVEGYRALAGKPPGPYALLAYDAAQVLLDALAADIRRDAKPSRQGTADALNTVQRDGLSGRVAFDGKGEWPDAPVYLYRISQGNLYMAP